MSENSRIDPRLADLPQAYAEGHVSRRGFIRGASGVLAAGVSIPGWMLGSPAQAAAAQTGGAAGPALAPLDLAEWSYFFVGVERVELARAIVRERQADVRRVVHSRAGAAPVSDRARARRRRAGARLDGHAGRTPRLGADSARGRLQGLRRRSSGARPIAVSPGRGRSVPRAEPARSNRCQDSSRRPTPARPAATTCASCTTSGRARASSARAISISSSPRRAARTCRRADSARRRGRGGRGAAGRGRSGTRGRRTPAAAPPPAAPAVLGADGRCPRAAPTASTWSGVSAAPCCSTRSVRRSS